MKKLFLFLAMLGGGFALAQSHRVGINTDTPRATLDVAKVSTAVIPANQPQGVIFPHISTAERDQFATSQLVEGMAIYNTDKNCIEYWDGTAWACTDE